ncbi:MAG TPA: hypothetical protein VE258_16940, partial [Ktedonobacterales bacterium]|nr:hypothetical protein [Ktedonobacterales bacterium]
MRETPSEARPAADWILTGASRLVTLAPGVCEGAAGTLGIVEGGALAAAGGRIIWVGRESELDGAVDRSGVAKDAWLDAGGRA